ncbi:MAG: ABC transporter ATP-binding protein [Solirubrobacterales bacterium]|nr:ABC transporter ATP-binding protein [Solirubrobacterales bacterium]
MEAATQDPTTPPETSPGQPALALEGLSRDFGDRVALGPVSAELAAGQTLAVLGRNGAGKSTLLRILAGLLRPSGGEARVLGCRLPGETWRLRGRVGYLGHRPLLYRDLSPRENLVFTARLHKLELAEAERRIGELLAHVGMERRANSRVAELSAGMVQRVDICRCVLNRPELLLLDEPDSHLDQEARELIEPLISATGTRARVLVSHDRERALAAADLMLELG